MRTLSACFLLYVLHNSTICYAVGEQVPSGCEAEASSPKSIYLSLVHKGLVSGAFTVDDVLWASAQKNPVSPFRSTRSPENLEIKRSLLRTVSLISQAMWSVLVADLQEFLLATEREVQRVDDAKVATASLFALQPLGIFAQNSSATSASGNLGIYASVNRSQTYVQRLRETQKVLLNNHPGPTQAATFFETSDGRILYASFSLSKLRVSDTASGDLLLDFDLNEFKRYREISLTDRKFRPILFEKDGRVIVAAVFEFLSTVPEIGRTKPVFLVDVESRDATEQEVPNGQIQYARFGRNQLFAFGVNEAANVIVHDLVADKEVLRTAYSVDENHIEVTRSELQLSMNEKGFPRLTIRDTDSDALYLVADIYLQTLERVMELEQLYAFHITSFSDDQGRLWSAKLTQESKEHGGRAQLTLNRNFEGDRVVDLDHLEDSSYIAQPKFLKTRDGIKVFIWELNHQLGVVTALHVVDIESRTSLRLRVPLELDIIKAGDISFDQEHNTINAFMKNEMGSLQLYQIFGPEDFGVRE